MSDTLYEKYGGTTAISKIVHEFYQRISETPSLDKYFSAVDLGNLIDHQIRFLSHALGGPDQYEGRSLREAHTSYHITGHDFAVVAEILKETLTDMGVASDDVDTIMETVGSVRSDIVTSE